MSQESASIRVVRKTCLPLSFFLLLWGGLTPMANAEELFVKDPASGCSASKPNIRATETMRWRGACLSGLATGVGDATWTAIDGSALTFSGRFVRGILQGEGRMTATGGDQYTGTYKDGKRDGYGIYISAGKDRYEGQYKDNLRHGNGVLISSSGERIVGQWLDGLPVSPSPAPHEGQPMPASSTALTALAQSNDTQNSPDALQQQAPVPAIATATTQPTQAVPSARQQAQQEKADRQSQLVAERQRLQEQKTRDQAAFQEQQRQAFAGQQIALERQQSVNSMLFWLLLASPVLIALFVWQLKWSSAAHAANVVGTWVDKRSAKLQDRAGFFVSYVERPTLWCARKLYQLTSSMDDQFLRAGVRLALCLYLIGMLLFLAYVVTAIIIGIFVIAVSLWVIGAVLGEKDDSSPRRSRVVPAFADGESRRRKGFFGDYVETRDSNGNVVSETREREGFFGKYSETTDRDGNVTSETREREGFLGPYSETTDKEGNVIAESRDREGFLGPYTETQDKTGKVVGESRERKGFLGDYTEHKNVER